MKTAIFSGLAIVVIAIAAAGGCFAGRGGIAKNPGASSRQVVAEPIPQPAAPAIYQWEFTESEADASGIPHTAVRVNAEGTWRAVGVYAGSCHEVRAGETGVLGEKPDAGEISRIQCWFAGGGDEVGVFQEGGKTVVKAGELGEGSAEYPPFRGNFKTIAEW